ncbi:MAG: hypothetical protein M1282_15100 [Chloroflexi bacterium]|nr:hypothetical protein [Chloroflexota bacterium]
MDILLNPNIAYILLVAGTFLALWALVVPGTGLAEIGAFFCVVLAAYSIYHLSFNWWALVLILLSIVPFFIAIQKPGREAWLVISIIGIIIGSAFFFPDVKGQPSVNPLLAIVTSALYAVFVWFSVRKVAQITQTKPAQDLSTLIGQRGEAKTSVETEGSVQVAGELWSARSKTPISAGCVVRVIGREGFVLIVEKDISS